MLGAFEHYQPKTTAEACALLAKYGSEAKVIAGGTDLLPQMKQRLLQPEHLVDVKRIPELRRIVWDEAEGLTIGATVTLAALISSPIARCRAPLLVEAARRVAAPPLQNMGTIGGNICLDTRCLYHNWSSSWSSGLDPCLKAGGSVCHVVATSATCHAVFQADAACALVALGAAVRLDRDDGHRTVRLTDFYSQDGQYPNRLSTGELLTQVLVPPAAESIGVYERLSERAALDFPQVAVAIAMSREPDRSVRAVRIVLNAVAPHPVEAVEAAQLLVGRRLEDDVIARAAEAATATIHPIKNTGVGPRYRRKMARVLTRRALIRLRSSALLSPARPSPEN